MITSIKVDGFKTLSNFKLALNPGLNVLVGPNGSGKTNLISFFEFLSMVIETSPSEATSRMGGVGAVFRRTKDNHQKTITATITGCCSQRDPESRGWLFEGDSKPSNFLLYKYSFSIEFSQALESVVFTAQQLCCKSVDHFHSANDKEVEGKGYWDFDVATSLSNRSGDDPIVKVNSINSEVLANYLPFVKHGPKTDSSETYVRKYFSFATPGIAIPTLLDRFNPLPHHPVSRDIAGGQTYNIIPSKVKLLEDSARPPGIHSDGSGLASTLYSLRSRSSHPRRAYPTLGSLWGSRDNPSGSMKRPQMQILLDYFRLANDAIQKIDVSVDHYSNQLRVTCAICNGGYRADVPLSLMSDGTLKWLTLLTAALTAPSVFSIEEPENYLHPKMQGKLITIMREILCAKENDTCTLMTTHSETVLNHCKPNELVIVSFENGTTVAVRCSHEREISDEIARTGFGLGYYYIAGALEND